MAAEPATKTRSSPGKAESVKTVKVLIAYYSVTGNTERMAQAVAEGVQSVSGASAVLRKVEDVTRDELEAAQGIILGSPTYYANIPGKMCERLEHWAWDWKVDFTDKVGGAFSTGGGPAAGKEHVIISLLLYMINNRMIVAGPLYEDPQRGEIWGELGATAMTGPLDPGVSPRELDAPRRLGERVARLAKCLAAH